MTFDMFFIFGPIVIRSYANKFGGRGGACPVRRNSYKNIPSFTISMM